MSIYRYVSAAAVSAIWALSASAETFCISEASTLRNALATASANGEDDLIQIVRGTYIVSLDFTDTNPAIFEGYAVTIEGGHNVGCTSRVANPANTIIDANFDESVIGFNAPFSSGPADFSIDALTLQNGRGKRGAGINISTIGNVTINNCIVRDNATSRPIEGGGIRIVEANEVVLSSNQINNNRADDGGGVSIQNANFVSIIGNHVIGNTASSFGGGLQVEGGCLERLTDNVIDGNSATFGGGLIRQFGTSCQSTISGNSITNNTAQFQGGGIYLQVRAELTGNIISGNASSLGGGLRISGSGSRVVNNLIVNNTGDTGAGAVLFGSVDFINNTVTGNEGTEIGGVWARLGSPSTVSLINNILVGNTGPVADLQIVDDGGAAADLLNNDFDHSSAIIDATILNMQNNLDAVDPHFVDATGANYQLKPTSPLINAGTNAASLPETDLAGNQRIAGGKVDIGAYEFPAVPLVSMANFNGDNSTDLGVLLRDAGTGKNKLYVMDGGSGNNIQTVSFGSKLARGSATVSDANGDQVPEFAVLLEGSLFARVKDVVNNTLLGKPKFNPNYDTVAFLSVGNAGGGAGPDVAVVGRLPATGKVQAWVKDVASGSLVNRMTFSKTFVPFAAVAVDNVGGSAAMEIAVLGIDASGNVQAQVKDALSGKLINKIQFNKKFTPLFFAAVPNAAGKLKYLAVLGRNANGVIQAQIKRVGNGTLVNNVRFSKSFDPKAFIIFADSNGSGSGEIGVVGVNDSGVVRAQVKEIANGVAVTTIKFSKAYPPLDAIAVNGVAGTGQNEIAVLGENSSNQLRLQIKDLLTGNLVKNIPVP